MYVVRTAFCMYICMTRKRAAYANRTNLQMPATISWWFFVHFRTRKHAASLGLRQAHMNVSAGLSDAYAIYTLSLLPRLFPYCKSRRNISSRSCHGHRGRCYDRNRYAHIPIPTHMHANSDTETNTYAYLKRWWNPFTSKNVVFKRS